MLSRRSSIQVLDCPKCLVIFLYVGFVYMLDLLIIPPVYKVYRGYIVFAFSVTMFVCLCVCVCKLFFPSKISQELLDLGS